MMIKIALIAAAVAQGQEIPSDGGRRPLNVDNFESQSALDFFNALDDFDSSTPDYMSEYNGALDEYDGASADDYAYDGITADEAGRPNANFNGDEKELDATQLFGNANTGNSNHAGKLNDFNQCLKCSGQTASECKTANVVETCNDAQDACVVQVRSQYSGTTVVHKYYSGCSAKASCEFQRARNFAVGDNFYNECRSTRMHNRFFQSSKCTFCTKLGKTSNSNSMLFGNSATTLYISASETARDIAAMFQDPTSGTGITDIYAANDWY
jgi:hypothetical protein